MEDIHILKKITSEVDENQVKVILSSQCIKAQTFLADRLRREAEKQKEACKYISSANCKLEAEIKHAEQELKSMNVAHGTIRSAMVEMKKELLLAKERKIDIAKRVELGEKKYEELWLQCKQRFESIPFNQRFFELTNETQELIVRFKSLDQEAIMLVQEIKEKKDTFQRLDNSRIIELAKYMIEERPRMIKDLAQKTENCHKLTAEIAQYEKEEEATATDVKHKEKAENPSNVLLGGYWPSLREHFSDVRDSLQMPKLTQPDKDLEMFTVNLEQIRHASKLTETTEVNATYKEVTSPKSAGKIEDIYVSSFFKSYLNTNEGVDTFSTVAETRPKSNAQRRLIDMLDDLNTNKENNYSPNVEPNVMQVDNGIEERYPIILTNNSELNKIQGDQQNIEVMEYEEIEGNNMTPSLFNAILDPPTQFLDMSQITKYGHSQVVEVDVHKPMDDAATIKSKLRKSQEGNEKKRVSFDLPVIQEESEDIIRAEVDEDKGGQDDANVSSNSQLNLSAGDESFRKIQAMILKKNYLDLSPDFVYAKQGKNAKVVTSKFLKSAAGNSVTAKPLLNDQDCNMEIDKPEGDDKRQGNKDEGILADEATQKPPENMDSFEDNNKTKKPDGCVAGMLFNHGRSGLPESLDVSMATTGFDDDDVDFAHGIDASLLLSPKANIPTPMSGETSGVFSQEVPNFLSGFRKSGFSFFGAAASTNAEADPAAATQGNNFNFNFCSDKKNRGGLFTIFQ